LHRIKQKLALGQTTPEEHSNLVTRAAAHGRRHRAQAQCTITIPTELLQITLCAKLASAGAEPEASVQELSRLLRLQLRHELQESSLWLVDAFDLLSGESGPGESCIAASEPGRSSEGSDQEWEAAGQHRSDRFIDDLCALMQRGNFRLLSQSEWLFAKSENFMFTLPVDVAWESLDSALISRLFVRHPQLGMQAAQLSRRVLVFHRGSGVEQMEGWFLEEKIDKLLDKLITEPWRRCYQPACRLLLPRFAATNGLDGLSTSPRLNEAEAAAMGLRHTQRKNFNTLLPSLHRLLRRFLVKLKVQEPTFDEVVVFYAEVPAGKLEQPQLRLKSFRDIPVADVEVVFPGLKVEGMKSADIVKNVVLLLSGVAVGMYNYIFATSAGWTVQASLICVLVVRLFQTWSSVVTRKAQMDDFIRSTLYHRSQDSQTGVLLYVVNSIEQHEHRESLLLYMLLLHQASASQANDDEAVRVSVADAEVMCANFLEIEFGVVVRLNISGTLHRLEQLGLVSFDDGDSFSALPLGQAISKLQRKWGHTQTQADVYAREPHTGHVRARAPPTLGLLSSLLASPPRQPSL